MRESFLVSVRALVRGHVLTMLLAAAALVHLVFPALVRGDGTDAGWREMFLRAVPGSVVAVVLVAILACACGMFSRERSSNRLALTMVRPAPAFSIALGRWFALCAVAAAVLACNALVTLVRCPDAPACRHHLAPTLPPPEVAAKEAMEGYLKDPQTPEAVRKAPRHVVLELLAYKELDRYDVVPPGGRLSWPFPAVGSGGKGEKAVSVRVYFTSAFSMRMALKGRFILGEAVGVVSNETQSVWDVPLAGGRIAGDRLEFVNDGTDSVMLRPRRDLELLLPADSFAMNLARATFQSFSTVALLAAFGLFLSSALSRPVAVFAALVLVAAALMAPGALAQFPGDLDISLANRIGLALSRGVSLFTSAFAAPSPVSDLATGRCIEWRELAKSAVEGMVVCPGALLWLSAVVLRRFPLAA